MELLNELHQKQEKKKCFLLRGYAGTGKTTLIKSIASSLHQLNYKTVLMAPTGRAAKVMSNYSGMQAHTIHRLIYQFTQDDAAYRSRLKSKDVRPSNTVFIVDEASMITDEGDSLTSFGNGLLHDLVEYVYSMTGNFIIFSGDDAQLPPVHKDNSPALDKKFLERAFGLSVTETEMREVVRQKKESGIIMNATSLRILVSRKEKLPVMKTTGFEDIHSIGSGDLGDALQSAYGSNSFEEVLIVCRSNKQANNYNKYIRNQMLFREEEVSAGDLMMVVKNNYYWLNDTEKGNGFIANGDVIRIQRTGNIEEKFGFRFMNVSAQLMDDENEYTLDLKLMLDTIYSESPALEGEKMKQLYMDVLSSYTDEKMTDRKRKVMQDPYFNAIQVKFSYAVTCHKAQGGQWKSVFIDQGFMNEEMYQTTHLRWLYTAVTRATEKLYLINFQERFFKN